MEGMIRAAVKPFDNGRYLPIDFALQKQTEFNEIDELCSDLLNDSLDEDARRSLGKIHTTSDVISLRARRPRRRTAWLMNTKRLGPFWRKRMAFLIDPLRNVTPKTNHEHNPRHIHTGRPPLHPSRQKRRRGRLPQTEP